MKINKILLCLGLGLILVTSTIDAFAPTNFFRPEDRTLRLPFTPKTGIKFGVNAEYGKRATGLNLNGERTNILQLYEPAQNTIYMVLNPSATVLPNIQNVYNATATLIYNSITLNQNNTPSTNLDLNQTAGITDTIRGYQIMTGKHNELDMTLMAGVKIQKTHGRLALNIYAPVKYMSVGDYINTDKTLSNEAGQDRTRDLFVQNLITNNLAQNVFKWGGLNLSNWRKEGFGDLLVQLDWTNRYEMEMKHFLKAMVVGLRAGVSCPTGVKKDVDQAFSFAFGTDDAWGFPLGATMEWNMGTKTKLGCNIDMLAVWDKKHVRRLKTNTKQTEFLLLNKGVATKHTGITLTLEPYLQFFHVIDRLSIRAAYQHIMHEEDSLSVMQSSGFDNEIINSAKSLERSRIHNAIFSLNYDAALSYSGQTPIYNIQLSAFYKVPFYGKGFIDSHTIGGQVAINW